MNTLTLDKLKAQEPATRLVIIGRGTGAGPDDVVAPSIDALPPTAAEPMGFYVDSDDAQVALSVARAVRASPWWDRPVWASAPALAREARGLPGAPTAAAAVLVDGQGSLAQARDAATRALAARRSLGLDAAALPLDERVLYFLFQRDAAELEPVADRQSAALYRYPQADALAHADEDVATYLTTLTRRRLLEPVALVDRTRHCLACGSAHPHFIDVCPHCHSIQVSKVDSLHCFACGFVGVEAQFEHEGDALQCPKCNVRLRHIGVDYDRPMAQFACGSCQRLSVETLVRSRCLDCSAEADPAELDVREVSTLRLSASGRAALRSGEINQAWAALNTAHFIDPPQFKRMLDWALAAQQRHEQMQFALVLVSFGNVPALIERLGGARVFMMLDEFARRLHELLRTSDLTTRTQEDKLWIFLPFSSHEGFVARLQRSMHEIGMASDGAGAAMAASDQVLQANVQGLQLTGGPKGAKPAKPEKGQQLMDRLQALI